MGTSRSPDWTARARVLSGRPDPTWPVPAAAARALLGLWATLEPAQAAAPTPPPLGYRGCILAAPDGEKWTAFAGVVTRTAEASVELRVDPGRRFEQRLLDTAPPGIAPLPRVEA